MSLIDYLIILCLQKILLHFRKSKQKSTEMASGLNDSFANELECPVCLAIPREVPVPACPVGHLVCKNCRGNLDTCPTCRRPMSEEGTNTLANKMIERIPHKCKYGCQVKNYLKEILEHEARCPDRMIKCPNINCEEQVQVSKFYALATRHKNKCVSNTTGFNASKSYSWVINTGSGESLDSTLSQSWDWKMTVFHTHGKLFYLHQHFLAAEKTMAYYVTLAEDPNEAKKYLAKVTLKNQNDERKSVSMTEDVISIDSAPKDDDSILASENVMFVHWKIMARFMKWIKETKDGEQYLRSTIDATIDISTK